MYCTAEMGYSWRNTVRSDMRPDIRQPIQAANTHDMTTPMRRTTTLVSNRLRIVNSAQRHLRSTESTCGATQNPKAIATNAACRWCFMACQIKSARITKCVKSRDRRVIASTMKIVGNNNQNGCESGSYSEGGCHSLISGQ